MKKKSHLAIPVIYALWSTRMRQLSSSIYFPDLTRKTSLVSRIYIYIYIDESDVCMLICMDKEDDMKQLAS
jgi:hypothetical protein